MEQALAAVAAPVGAEGDGECAVGVAEAEAKLATRHPVPGH